MEKRSQLLSGSLVSPNQILTPEGQSLGYLLYDAIGRNIEGESLTRSPFHANVCKCLKLGADRFCVECIEMYAAVPPFQLCLQADSSNFIGLAVINCAHYRFLPMGRLDKAGEDSI